MTAPWLDRLPTAEEVEAHAAEHGVEYGCAGRIGLWMLREEHEPVPLCGELQLGRGGTEGWDYLWSPHIGEHEGGDTVKLGPGDRLCPLTADGMPVALVTEVEQLRTAIDVQAAAVRGHHAAQGILQAAEARDAATLRRREATPGDTLAEIAAAREEAQRWNVRATEMEAERDALRAIVEGRTTPPTPAEMLAHWRAGGWWLVLGADGQLRSECVREDGDVFRGARRIIAADRDGRPCAWPVVEVTPDAVVVVVPPVGGPR